MHKDTYSDIIDAVRPAVPWSHPRMDVSDRAKIFSPFAALRGFGERIAEEDGKRRDDETQGYGAYEFYKNIYP